jgi:hypothetical protein
MALQVDLKHPMVQSEIDFATRIANLLQWKPEFRHIQLQLWSDGDFSVSIDSSRELITVWKNENCKICGKGGNYTASIPSQELPTENYFQLNHQPLCYVCIKNLMKQKREEKND